MNMQWMSSVNAPAVLALAILASSIAAWNGCVTRAQARKEAAMAFKAGEQATLMRLQRVQGPSVTVAGEVREPFVPWNEGLTLARAIVLAGYLGATDPGQITIIRRDQEIRIDPARLLRGEDFPVQDGDVIRLDK